MPDPITCSACGRPWVGTCPEPTCSCFPTPPITHRIGPIFGLGYQCKHREAAGEIAGGPCPACDDAKLRSENATLELTTTEPHPMDDPYDPGYQPCEHGQWAETCTWCAAGIPQWPEGEEY